MDAMRYRFGIDAGSKTIKVVVFSEEGVAVHTVYRRHRGNIRQTMQEILHDIIWRFGDLEGSFAITGSAGIELAELLDLLFVQEVLATTEAVQTFIPHADTIIELGGEDAKIVYIAGGLEQRMNATCAGGTGGFIDSIAFMLGIRTKDMSGLSLESNRIYPLASRCAVFAQTDVRPLLNSGVKKSDIAASTLEAVVKQTIGGLACGRPITGTVVFLGGPLEHIPDLVYRFRRNLGLSHKTGIKPDNAHLFTAMGAAVIGGEEETCLLKLSELEERLRNAPNAERDLAILPPLFNSQDDLVSFRKRHTTTKVSRKDISHVQGPLFVGIDAGSATVKLAVIDDEKNLVYSDYRPTKGDPLRIATLMLEQLNQSLVQQYSKKRSTYISHATVTGYGEDLLEVALNIDSGIVETLAHARACQHLYPDADFILDIGGQDMKALWIKNGAIQDAVLNEACSSGCGSFIEGTAYSLQLNPYSFAELALQAAHPIDLGMKCTVFMTSRVRHSQKIGVPYGDIAAGLAYSVVQNALFKIIGMKNLDDMGEVVVVQGGAFMSDAILRAFELVSGKQVIRPEIAHLMGAFGAALCAQSRADGTQSGLVINERLSNLKQKQQYRRCVGCTNSCLMTLLELSQTHEKVDKKGLLGIEKNNPEDCPVRVFVSGNRCSRAPLLLKRYQNSPSSVFFSRKMSAHSQNKGLNKAPNLFALEQKLLARFCRHGESSSTNTSRKGLYIGIPPVLNLYETLPFWHTLLTELGFSVIVSALDSDEHESSVKGFQSNKNQSTRRKNSSLMKGLETVPSESVCSPAKNAHMHIAQLIEADVDALLFPVYERGSRCPVSTKYCYALKNSIPELRNGSIALISPTLQAIEPTKIAESSQDLSSLLDALQAFLPTETRIDTQEFDKAISRALQKQEDFVITLETATKVALEWLEKGHHGIVLASRPYHVDKTISHGIDEILSEFGLAVFSPLGLRRIARQVSQHKSADEKPFSSPGTNTWRPAKHLVGLAKYVAQNESLDLVCLYSFGCGFDSLSLVHAKNIIKQAGKVFTAFKIDEITDLLHIRIRLRTLIESLTERDARNSNTIAKENLPAHKGIVNPRGEKKIVHLQPLIQKDTDTSRAFVNHDICSVTAYVAGQAIRLLKEDPDITTLIIPRFCQSCLLDDVDDLVHQALGFSPKIIWTDTWALDRFSLSHSNQQLSLPPFRKETLSQIARNNEYLRPKIGLLGTALFCFDEFANHNIACLIEEQGCTPVFPDPCNLFVEDVRYIKQIEAYRDQGIRHIVYLQAFGCLKGHVETRGALRSLERLYPGIHISPLLIMIRSHRP